MNSLLGVMFEFTRDDTIWMPEFKVKQTMNRILENKNNSLEILENEEEEVSERET